MRIFLTGFMGAGKTVVGRALAERLGIAFVDLDGEIEAQAGLSVREIFAQWGESEFRRRERAALERALEQPEAVVATGGGTLTFAENRDLIAGVGVVVWLHPPFDVIVSRLGGTAKADRPLFRDDEQAWALYQERLPAYRRCDLRLDVGAGETPEELASRIVLALRIPCAT